MRSSPPPAAVESFATFATGVRRRGQSPKVAQLSCSATTTTHRKALPDLNARRRRNSQCAWLALLPFRSTAPTPTFPNQPPTLTPPQTQHARNRPHPGRPVRQPNRRQVLGGRLRRARHRSDRHRLSRAPPPPTPPTTPHAHPAHHPRPRSTTATAIFSWSASTYTTTRPRADATSRARS